MTIKDTALKHPTAPRAGTELEVAFTDLLANGQAVGRVGGVVVFCFGPLPQETARVVVTTVKPKYVVAELRSLVVTSPDRAQPFCPVFGDCGGCQVQHLGYPAQLAWKRDVLRNALARIGGFGAVDVHDTVGMAVPRDYRNKMSLVVEEGSPEPTIGFYRQRSHDVVPIDACPIVMPQLSGYVARLNAARSNSATAPALAQARHLVARGARASAQAVLTITTVRESDAVRAAAPALLADLLGVVGITNSFDRTGENAILGRRHRVLTGSPEIEETIGGVRYRVSAESFFQVNVEIVGRIFAQLESELQSRPNVVDLYCGAGTFSLYFARYGCAVFGIEESAPAIAEARANAVLNGLEERVTFQTGRVEAMVAGGPGRAALAGAQVAFLDPPRKGSDEATLGAIAAAGVPNVWYLSCDPATLARDLKFLAAKGYSLGAVRPFDMFPQTGHVEALVTLHRTRHPSE
ncbi:MAG TPA: 23S rRNA (uracil(1939)-C(5))-methyltransferase RlmD [Candidatus Tumulicola sp.]